MGKEENGKEKDSISFSTVEKYRLILGLGLHGGVPSMEELPSSFLLPADILKDMASARQQTSQDRIERTQCTNWDGTRYNHGRVYQYNLPTLTILRAAYLPHKALLYWRTYGVKTSFIPLEIADALMLPNLAFIHALATPDDIQLMVQTKESARLPIMHWVSALQGRIGYPFAALHNNDLGGIAQFLQKRGFGMYQLAPSTDKLNPLADSGYKFQRISP